MFVNQTGRVISITSVCVGYLPYNNEWSTQCFSTGGPEDFLWCIQTILIFVKIPINAKVNFFYKIYKNVNIISQDRTKTVV
jgi:hypothetical protein